jgi:ring-1,2-phenylacetyl-CoA epoxidase subunit PaaE
MVEFVKQYFTGALSGLSLFAAVYFVFWIVLGKKLSNRKIQLSKRAGWPQIKGEIVAALLSSFGSTLLMLLLIALKDNGTLKFYTEPSGYGVWYQVVIVFVLLIVSDTWFYWSHRAMHHPRIYKYVHALHHKSLDVNPFTSQSFHIIEAVWLTLWLLPLAMVMPISMSALGVMQVLGMFNNLKSHLGYEFFPAFFSKVPPFNMLVNATNHSLHHTQYNGNYGLFFRFWDIVCGTELKTTTATFDEIHTREHSVIIDNTKYGTLTIDKLVKENAETVSVYFKPADKEFYNYKAGQYLTVRIKVDGKTHNRCFSLSSAPCDDFLRITVKLKGEVSHWLYNDAQVGDTIESLLPVGDFNITPNVANAKHYVMVAGGSGITPLYSMMKQILYVEPNSKINLLYANANKDNIIFKEELAELRNKWQQLNIEFFISGEKRISSNDLANYSNAQFYICGPDSLKENVMKNLKDLKVPNENINTENFADGYVAWFGLFSNKKKGSLGKAAVL